MGLAQIVLAWFGCRPKRQVGVDSSQRLSTDHDAGADGIPMVGSLTDEEILAEARRTGPLLSDVMDAASAALRPGITTLEINQTIERALKTRGFSPAMKGYNGFAFSSAIACNEEILHGVPSSRRIAAGDLVKLQTAGATPRGWASQGWTYSVGPVSESDSRMLETAATALRAAREVIRTGARIGDLGAAIQSSVESAGYAVVRQFHGYAMGRRMIGPPGLPGYGRAGQGARLRGGEILHAHVILKDGSPNVVISEDGWTAKAADGKRGVLKTCMMEVQEGGCRLLGRFLDPA